MTTEAPETRVATSQAATPWTTIEQITSEEDGKDVAACLRSLKQQAVNGLDQHEVQWTGTETCHVVILVQREYQA